MHRRSFLPRFLSCLQVVLEVLLSTLLSLIVVPVLVSFWLVNQVARVGVRLILAVRFKGGVVLASHGADNIWEYRKSGNHRVCLSATFHEKPIDVTQERQLVTQRILLKSLSNGCRPYEKLRRKFLVKCGYVCMKIFHLDDMKIESHVKIYETEGNRVSGILSEKEFLQKVLPVCGEDFPEGEDKPPWEILIIPGVELGGVVRWVRLFRWHHGLMDGASLLNLYSHAMFDSDPKAFPFIVSPLRKPQMGGMVQWAIWTLHYLRFSYGLVKALWDASQVSGRFALKDASGIRHYSWSRGISSSTVRSIRHRMRISVPGVFAAATASALWKLEKKFPGGRSNKESSSVVLGMVTALLPYKDTSLTNQFTVTHFQLPSGNKPMAEVVAEVQKEWESLLFNPQFLVTPFLFRFFGKFPYRMLRAVMAGAGNPISFSNVPLSSSKIALWENQVEDFGGWAPLLTNTGMAVTITRYSDTIRFEAVADDNCLSGAELEYFLEKVADDLESMGMDRGHCCSSRGNNKHISSTMAELS